MSYYSDNAPSLFKRYHNKDSARLHRDWLPHLPERPGRACDIGAGTGRDANWLAEQGWEVIAVEPESAFRELAKQHSHPNVTWLDDQLPNLERLRKLNQRFKLILLSAVWMHLSETQRVQAFSILSELLAPGGILVISLRHGTDAEENSRRGLHKVSVMELERLARERAIAIKSVTASADGNGRAHVSWETVVLELPDAG